VFLLFWEELSEISIAPISELRTQLFTIVREQDSKTEGGGVKMRFVVIKSTYLIYVIVWKSVEIASGKV